MSLINNMLKELEKRDRRDRDKPLIPLIKSYQRKKNTAFQKKITQLSLLITFVIALWVSHFFIPKKTVTLLPFLSNNEIITSPLATPASKNDSWLKSVVITGMTLQVKDNITELSFLLNHVALYRLNSDDALQNQLSLVIENAELQSSLPAINSLNTAIGRITTQTFHGDTIFNLSLYPGALIKYINLNEDVKNPELVIAIQYQPLGSSFNNTSSENNLIKTPVTQSVLTQQYQAALTSVKRGYYQSAINRLSSLLDIAPDDNEARVSLIALLMNQHLYWKANELVDRGLLFSPDHIPFIELKARLLTLQGKTQQALAVLQRVSPSMTDNPDYHAFMAALYERNNDDLLAMKLYKQLLAINPQNGRWWFGLGVSLEKLGQPKAATEAYSRALAEGHLNAEAMAYLQKRFQTLQKSAHEKG